MKKQEFRWTYLIPSLSIIPILIASVMTSSNPISFMFAILGITFGLIAVIFAATV